MSGWTHHKGKAVAYDRESVDTDQLIPARFMSTPRAEGYGNYLLRDIRFDSKGNPVADFPLNRHPDASVIVSRRNFGTGSSREAAVYALVDFGIRAVVAPSFGDIFASNAVNNGLLPARISEKDTDQLIALLSDCAEEFCVDLDRQTLSVGNLAIDFELDPVWRQKLINGWDDIDLTLNHRTKIADYRTQMAAAQSWKFPAKPG